MNFAVVYCPVSFSANGYSDYYVFTVVALCNWCCVTYTPHSVMCYDLCHCILPCVIQCKWLFWLLCSAYTQLSCDATDATCTYTLHTDMCYEFCRYILPCILQCKWLFWLLCIHSCCAMPLTLCYVHWYASMIYAVIYCPVFSVQPAILVTTYSQSLSLCIVTVCRYGDLRCICVHTEALCCYVALQRNRPLRLNCAYSCSFSRFDDLRCIIHTDVLKVHTDVLCCYVALYPSVQQPAVLSNCAYSQFCRSGDYTALMYVQGCVFAILLPCFLQCKTSCLI